ncbi:YraN family protein [Deltaproteobacteria bacterium TL4]
MSKKSQALGIIGEELAYRFLKDRSYKIIERNFRCELGELDIIAQIEEYLVFCEVKTRKSNPIHPSSSITAKKIKKLRQLGLFYMNYRRLQHMQPRFDVIAVQVYGQQEPVIEHFINAL